MRLRHVWLTAIVLTLLTSGCVAPESAPRTDQTSGTGLVWPQAPAEPRVRYLRSVSGPFDLGIAKPLLRRLAEALTGGDDERFVRPTGVAERNGVLYVADPGTPAVWILDPAHDRFVKVSAVNDRPLASPVAVAARPDGAVFVADTGLKEVLLLDADGKLLGVAAKDNLERPAAVAYEPANQRLYVADSARHKISVYGQNGTLLDTWGHAGTEDGEFNFPTHIALDKSGTVLVTDALNFRIQAFDKNGSFLWKLGRHGDGSGDFAAPKGLASDSAGHIYVVDALFDAVQIFERDGTLLLAFGGTGPGPGQFWLPAGLFIGAENRTYVADAHNGRVQVFQAGLGTEEASGQ